MRTLLPVLAMIALGGFSGQASAQAPCPEFARLRSEAEAQKPSEFARLRGEAEAQKPARHGLVVSGCEAYIRSSVAWRAVVEYADEHRTVCNISDRSVSEFEKNYREAVSLRNNVCAGRPARPFPPDIIQR
jgi:hypothetical protein